MAQVEVKNVTGQGVGSMELDDTVFGEAVNEHLLWEVVKWQQAKRRAGTHSTKLRGEVRGTNKKPYKQKGTGNARRGDVKSPVAVGGGIVFGPRPRDYGYTMPRKAKKKALRSALSLRLSEGKLVVVDDFKVEGGKTKSVSAALSSLDAGDKALIVDSKENLDLVRGARNLARSKWLAPEGLNVYDVLNHETLIISQGTVKAIEEALRP